MKIRQNQKQVFIIIFLTETETETETETKTETETGVWEALHEYPYLFILIKLWPGGYDNQLERMDIIVYEDNGESMAELKGQSDKVQRFSSNEFWNSIGFIISAPTFGIGISRLWEKEEAQNIRGKKVNRFLIE